MSLTDIATRSIPIVSWTPASMARRSLVPTPSVPATRKESPVGGVSPVWWFLWGVVGE